MKIWKDEKEKEIKNEKVRKNNWTLERKKTIEEKEGTEKTWRIK